MPRYLVVAHRTLLGAHVFDHLQVLCSDDPACEFHVVVPQYHPRELLWAEGTTYAIAQQRLDEMLQAMAEVGLSATGEVGRPNPVNAVSDCLEREGADSFAGIILSTLPRGVSRWWTSGVPRRIEKQFPSLPVTHLVATNTLASKTSNS